MADSQLRKFDYETAEIGEEPGSFDYVLTQEMLDNYRRAVEDPDANFPTIAARHDSTALGMLYEGYAGPVNSGNEVEFHNPPIPRRRIKVTGRIADKYQRREKPYLVIEATAVDDDGHILEKTRTYQMLKPDELGKKWQPQDQKSAGYLRRSADNLNASPNSGLQMGIVPSGG